MSNDLGIKIVSVVSGVSSEFDVLFDVIVTFVLFIVMLVLFIVMLVLFIVMFAESQ